MLYPRRNRMINWIAAGVCMRPVGDGDQVMRNVYQGVASVNEKVGPLLLIVSIPSLLNDLNWWAISVAWLVENGPNWTSLFIEWFGATIHPIIQLYMGFTAWAFSWLPFQMPAWLSAILPPAISVFISILFTRWHEYRALTLSAKEYSEISLREKVAIENSFFDEWKIIDIDIADRYELLENASAEEILASEDLQSMFERQQMLFRSKLSAPQYREFEQKLEQEEYDLVYGATATSFRRWRRARIWWRVLAVIYVSILGAELIYNISGI